MLRLTHVAASLLALTDYASGLAYTNVSEVPYYGLSPPAYPTRKSVFATLLILC